MSKVEGGGPIDPPPSRLRATIFSRRLPGIITIVIIIIITIIIIMMMMMITIYIYFNNPLKISNVYKTNL